MGRLSAATGLAGTGVDLAWYTTREREYDEVLPWDHLDSGLDKDWLWADWEDALAVADGSSDVEVEDCRWTPCYDCGACTGYGIEHVVASAVPPAGGSQGTGQDLHWGSAVPVALSSRRPVGVGA